LLEQPEIGDVVAYHGSEDVFSMFYKPVLLWYVLGAVIVLSLGTVSFERIAERILHDLVRRCSTDIACEPIRSCGVGAIQDPTRVRLNTCN